MKKKLEAELISIAHRILKLKNRAELDQLQQETLKLYEKISVLRFVEDNFNDVKPTIGYASAEEKLEDIYGIEEAAPVHANEVEAKEEEKKAKAESQKPQIEEEAKGTSQKPQAEEGQDKENDKGEGVTAGSNPEEVVSEEEKEETAEMEDEAQDDKNEEGQEPTTDDQQPEEIAEGGPASEEEKRYTEEETDETAEETPAQEEPKAEELKEEPKQAPLFDFDKPEEPKKQKEITFEDYRDYKEPEFVKKSDLENPQSINKEFLPKEPEVIQKQDENAAALSEQEATPEPKTQNTEPTPVRDWRDWEPSTSPYASKKEEPKAEEPSAVSNQQSAAAPDPQPATRNPEPVQPATPNPQLNNRVITLGLNDRIAFEKHLFGGSGEDLNRVISQLNTFNTFRDAKDFINDLVKPDYNNWKGKEEYEERLMELVEKRFS